MFCGIVAGVKDEDKIWEDEEFIVIKDANPKVEGHFLMISKEHYETFMDLPDEVGEKLFRFVREIVEKIGIKDFNLVTNNGKVAGQVVSHFHLHILSRREGDGFRVGV